MKTAILTRRTFLAGLLPVSILAQEQSRRPLIIQIPKRQITISNPSVKSQTPSLQPRRNIGVFFDKLRAGKALTVAYLGGSITAGVGINNPDQTSWRARVTEWLKSVNPRAEITELDVSVAGTGSLYATLRARRDVIAYKPDLVFIEFAVSDLDDDEGPVKKAVEGLLRQFLIVPQPPEIVMLYAGDSRQQSRRAWHDTLATYYQVPAIDLHQQITASIEAGEITASEIWKNGVPLAVEGHRIYAESIVKFLEEQRSLQPTPIMRNLPPPLVSDEMNYGEFKAFAEVKISPGQEVNWKIEGNNERTLPTLLLESEKPGAELEYYFEGTVLGLTYRAGPDAGMIECLIDGKPAPAPLASVDLYQERHQLGTRIIAGGLGPGEHKLTIRVLPDRNKKSSGNHVRLGYLLVGGQRPERL